MTRLIVSVTSSGRFTMTLRYSMSSTSTSRVADTAKNGRSSTRRCFVGAFAERLRAARPGEGGKFGEGKGEEGRGGKPLTVREGDDGAGDGGGRGESVSEGGRLRSSSGGSWMDASTIMSTIRCTEGATSAAFHCSSSTSFADSDSWVWWKCCKKLLAWKIAVHCSQYPVFDLPVQYALTWLTIAPRKPTIIRLQMISDFTTKSQDSLNSAQKLGRSSAVCCSARTLITFDARAFASSAAEDRMSDSSSCSAAKSTLAFGDLTDHFSYCL